MAVLELQVESQLEDFKKLYEAFPEMRGRLLALFGSRARQILKEQFLSGQYLDLRKFPTDKAGRYTITSNVDKTRKFTKVSSYPVNLFEKGRKLRSGETEPGMFIITQKLGRLVESGKNAYLQYFMNDILSSVQRERGIAT